DARGSWTPKSNNVHDYATKNRIRLQNSRKLDCPATMQIRCIKVYNEYFIDKAMCPTENSMAMARRAVLKQMNEKSKSDPEFNFRISTRFYVKIPLSSAHFNHPVSESSTIGQYVDRRIVEKIYELVNRNITNISELKGFLTSTLTMSYARRKTTKENE
ncbi:hypothetical protein OS493_037959, partial [Desmophyllum pertusum]